MAFWSFFPSFHLLSLLFLSLISNQISLITTATTTTSVRIGVILKPTGLHVPVFREAPAFRNGRDCGADRIHVAMTLDANYLRGIVKMYI